MEYRLVILPVLLIILLALYYTNFKSNMIIMLSLIIVLVVFDLLQNSEHFTDAAEGELDISDALFTNNTSTIQHILREQNIKINSLEEMIRVIKKYKNKENAESIRGQYPSIPLRNSCIMLTSDGTDEDVIPSINDVNDSIFNENNPNHHSLGRDHDVYNQILNQLNN